MFQLLQKASQFIAPSANESAFEVFQESYQTVLANIKNGEKSSDGIFVGALNEVQSCLTEEIENEETPCFDDFVGNSVLQKIADSIDESLPESRLEPLLSFFLSFVNTVLNRYFLQFSVNRPFTQLLGKLDSINLIDSTETTKFVSTLWEVIHPSPVMLEMLNIDNHFPLFDYLFKLALLPDVSYNFAREALLTILDSNSNSNSFEEQNEGNEEKVKREKFPEVFFEYIKNNFFPRTIEFILRVTENISKDQFTSEFLIIFNFLDNAIKYQSFECDSLIEKISSRPPSNRLLTSAFLLSSFSSPFFLQKISESFQTDSFISAIKEALDSDSQHDNYAAILFLKVCMMCNEVLNNEKLVNELIPPVNKEYADVLSAIPPEWLLFDEGSASMKSYIDDASSRIVFMSNSIDYKKLNNDSSENNERKNGQSDSVYDHLIKILSKFNKMSINAFLSLSEVIVLFVAFQPDLISKKLEEMFEDAVKQYESVHLVSLPTQGAEDSPEVRASLLAEFAKEIHATFIAAERAKAEKESNKNNDTLLESE
ncbi:hypothetical protein TRFO_38565 [Tritrichomonas foetus]|uniref:Uncharacterized protein n=1 Tax=Tritrichomonas foetus TaxID=1144522 RepID=A0A1J4J805_9EUKA|nr:hypothetical protein TRFO_38565 [Tritrichomonas foetus]|eukprot:OHS95330.1 hypothetical protein TRFO_38565 [Tritrichomonas foetus]